MNSLLGKGLWAGGSVLRGDSRKMKTCILGCEILALSARERYLPVTVSRFSSKWKSYQPFRIPMVAYKIFWEAKVKFCATQEDVVERGNWLDVNWTWPLRVVI